MLRRSGALIAAPYALATLLSGIASVGAVVLLTRLLSAEGYGLYAATLGLVAILQNAGYMALQTGLIRFHARAADRSAELRLATAVRLAFLLATAAVAVVWGGALLWLEEAGVSGGLALAGLALLVLRGWLSIVQAWNRALGRHWTYLLLEAVQSFGSLALAAAVLHLRPGDADAALWAAAAATAMAAMLSPALLGTAWRPRGCGAVLRELGAYGAPLALTFLAGAILSVFDRLLIAVHVGAAAAGAYAVAFAIADRAMNLLLLPMPVASKPGVFTAWERGGEAAARPLLERSARWLILLGFPAATILIFAPEPVARLLADGGMAPEAARMIPWLTVGSLLSCLVSLHFAIAFQLTRRTWWMLLAIGPPAALNVLANALLIPRFGVVAAGWTTIACYGTALLLAILIGRRQARIPFPIRTAAATLAACVPLAAAVQWAAG